jgi:hypothetical protein
MIATGAGQIAQSDVQVFVEAGISVRKSGAPMRGSASELIFSLILARYQRRTTNLPRSSGAGLEATMNIWNHWRIPCDPCRSMPQRFRQPEAKGRD